MFKNAVEKLNKFYEFNFSQNPNRIFEILSGIIEFNSAAIFYLTPNTLSLEFEKNFSSKKILKLKMNYPLKSMTHQNMNLYQNYIHCWVQIQKSL